MHFSTASSEGVIEKTETEYKSTVGRITREMRRAREVPFSWLADTTRWMRKLRSYSSVEDLLVQGAQSYRRNLWADHDAFVEVWLEKDALAGVVYDVTKLWDVPLMVTRGYPSLSYLHSAAEAIEDEGKPAFLYYLGDHDPSGVDITRAVEQGIREFAPGAEIAFERIAVTPDQIRDLRLPTRPRVPGPRALARRGPGDLRLQAHPGRGEPPRPAVDGPRGRDAGRGGAGAVSQE
jgi:hypothetical protein